MTLRDDYGHWANSFYAPMARAWGDFLDAVRYGLFGDDRWEDLRFPFTGNRIDISSGRIDYDYEECTVDFATNARYDDEPVCFIIQMPHAWSEGTAVRPHLHWLQEEDDDPNWLLRYRTIANGGAPGSWTNTDPSTLRTYTYSSGTLLQITKFPEISMTGLKISDFIDCILFRDQSNSSGEFSSSDTYSVAAKAKEFDIHYQVDSDGSSQEYVK